MSNYRQLYCERGKPQSDSSTFRGRLGAFLDHQLGNELKSKVIVELEQKIYPLQRPSSSALERFVSTAKLVDLLTAITVIFKVLKRDTAWRDPGAQWKRHVRECLDEENMAYRLDDDGTIHPFVDREFERNRISALRGLEDHRFDEARHSFEQAFKHFRNGDHREALIMMFQAVESTTKVLCNGQFSHLSKNEVGIYIGPKLQHRYAGNQPALSAGKLLLKGFGDWVNAAHLYRHAQGTEKLADPPDDFVVAHMSMGAAYLRWVLDLFSPGGQ